MSSKQISIPEWVKDAIFYQIFPDRFARSDAVAKPSHVVPWDASPHAQQFQGGDLVAVREKLDYLKELGVNAIYFNPIFRSTANHRYMTHDYYQVCPILGGNEALRDLVDEMHRRGMRIVLDGVFNHASRGFYQFNDILENGPHSPWIDWFFVDEWPLSAYDGDRPANYRGWAGNRALPKINTDHADAREFLMQVGEYWIREYGIDGWRLDVPLEITTEGFWEEFRTRIKKVNPEAYIVAEIWGDASEHLQGDRFDASMNYQFTSAVGAFVGGETVSRTLVENRPEYRPFPPLDAAGYAQRIEAILAQTPWPVTQAQLNSLSTHDIPRFRSVVQEDGSAVRIATLLQLTYPGAPCIYYGDEIGLRGTTAYDQPHQDNDARWTFPWADRQRWDESFLSYTKYFTGLRHDFSALRRGAYKTVHAEGMVYAFTRSTGEETLLVVVNAGNSEASVTLTVPALAHGAPLDTPFEEAAVAIQEDAMTVTIPPRSGAVLR